MKIFKIIFYCCLFCFMFVTLVFVSIKPKAINEQYLDYNELSTKELTEVILDNGDMLVFNTANSYKQGFE